MNLKNENKIIQRNYGIDALRMLSMFMVVVLHILLLSGLLTNEQLFSTQYEIAWLLEICVYCAVNCYALISGYVGVDSKFRFSNIIVLWLRVVFYTFIITMVFFVFIPNSVTKLSFIKALFPVMSSQYWYFTAYFAMFFFIPLLNAALNQIDRIRLKIILISLIILFSVLQTLFCRDVFSTGLGYTAWWLMILYLIGGYIKKYGFLEKCKSGLLFLGYCMMVWITWGSKFIIEKGT